MGLARMLVPIRRRQKGLLIGLFIILIVLLIVNHTTKYQYEVVEGQTNVRNINPRRFNLNPLSQGQTQRKDSPPLKEHIGEFDTRDIYKHIIAGEPDKDGGHHTGTVKRSTTDEKLKVFVLPFTHVDPGWLHTFDKYTEDTNKILNNMHKFMSENEAMRFMWAEFVFFERWWSNQTDHVKSDVRKFVKEGRLELASGSWVMTDEANAYFAVSVDNIVEGQQYLLKEFGAYPSTIWTNDPFGYSNSVPYLFKQSGVKHNVINRIHHRIKGHLQRNHAIPFKWRQYFDSESKFDVWTHVLPYAHYDVINSCGPNGGVCCEFDFKRITHWNCPGPKPVPITKDNVVDKANRLVSQLKEMAKMYEAPVLLMVHGDDFRFDMIEEWHQQHDNFMPVFEQINKGDQVEISFGTFSDYFDAMEKWYTEKNKQPATLTGDFFPYQCALGDLWTGYYTTRPFYKRQGRILHHMIRSADILATRANKDLKPEEKSVISKKLESARRTLSLFQHHDAITGTSKKHVMKNYSELLFMALKQAEEALLISWSKITGTEAKLTHDQNSVEETSSKLQLHVAKDTQFVTVYNPLPYAIEDTVSVRVESNLIGVKFDGEAIKAQIEPYVHLGKVAQKTFLLTFRVKMEPLSIMTYELVPGDSSSTIIADVYASSEEMGPIREVMPSIFKLKEFPSGDVVLSNKKFTTSHDPKTGLLKTIDREGQGIQSVESKFVIYDSRGGGAYIMRNSGAPRSFVPTSVPKLIVKGEIQQSIHLFMEKIYHRMTVKNVEGVLGSQVEIHVRINMADERNKEVALQITTDQSLPHIYADSVGMQLLRREHYGKMGTPENYYPMPSAAVIEDNKSRLTISSNLEHGVMPLKNGVEIMIERMLNQDDGKGLGSDSDSLPTDLKAVDMQFAILLESVKPSSEVSHYSAHTLAGHISTQNVIYPPIIAVSSAKTSIKEAELALPCEYQLLTIRDIGDEKKLLTVFRNGVVESKDKKTSASCGNDVMASLIAFLRSSGATTVQLSNLSGTDLIGNTFKLDQLSTISEPAPFGFLNLVVSYDSK